MARSEVLAACLGRSKGWKPPRVGGCVGEKVPSESRFGLDSRVGQFLDFDAVRTQVRSKRPKRGQPGSKRCAAWFSGALKGHLARPSGHKGYGARLEAPVW